MSTLSYGLEFDTYQAQKAAAALSAQAATLAKEMLASERAASAASAATERLASEEKLATAAAEKLARAQLEEWRAKALAAQESWHLAKQTKLESEAKAKARIESEASSIASAGAAAAAQRQAAATKASSDALNAQGAAARKAGETGAKLAAALNLVSPAAGMVSANLGKVAAVGDVVVTVTSALGMSLSALAPIVAGVVIGLAPLAIAWKALAEQGEEASRAQNAYVAGAKGLRAITDANAEAQAELNKIRGIEESDSDRRIRVSKEVESLVVEESSAVRDHVVALRAELDALVDSNSLNAKRKLELREQIAQSRAQIEAQERAGDRLVESRLALEEYNVETERSARFLDERARAEARSTEESQKAKAAATASAAAAKADLSARIKQLDDYNAALEAVQGIGAEAAASELEGIAAVEAARDAAQAKLLAQYEAAAVAALEGTDQLTQAYEAYTESRLALDHQYDAEVDAIEAERIAAQNALRDEQAEADIARQRMLNEATLSSTAGLIGTISSMLAQGNEKQKAAAKVLAYAQIAISTAAGIQKAIQDYGLPYGLIPAAAVVASGVAQTAAVASAHQGGVVYAHQGRTPDEVDLRVLKTESVNNSQATRELTPQGVSDRNGLRSQPMVIEMTTGRAHTREMFRQEVRGNGSMTRWVRGRGNDRDAGFSGAVAVP